MFPSRSSRLFLLALSAILTAQAAPEVEITAEPHHHLILENEYVRVFHVDVPAHTDTLMHWHRHDYVFVTLGATEVVNAVKGKAPVTLKLQDGETHLLPAPFAHVARNLSDRNFLNLTIELLYPVRVSQGCRTKSCVVAPAKWDETRGLDILQGGTKEILFANDGVRGTEFELQPGGVVPMHHHTGPHLLMAVSDLDLRDTVPRSDVASQNSLSGNVSGPMPVHFKSGEAKWLPAGYSHSLTNAGQQPAKFVTLEFP
jgi:oxalate decarboxylase/phosphoglucose isomerase-like protein (cupin superfamily)